MHFLCLHGAIGNLDNISVQLGPLQKELQADNAAVFHYIPGPVVVDPPPGFEDYFGIGPHYRWMEDGGSAESGLLTRIRELPAGQSPEDVMRALSRGGPASWRNREEVMRYLHATLDANPDIEGIVGYSEGATVAASLLIDEEEQSRKTGRPKRIKCALFFTGWPPIAADNTLVLSDSSDLVIDIPTLHVVGANDPYRDGAVSLYNVCNADKAEIFDTGRGHTIPRGGPLVAELAEAVRDMISQA